MLWSDRVTGDSRGSYEIWTSGIGSADPVGTREADPVGPEPATGATQPAPAAFAAHDGSSHRGTGLDRRNLLRLAGMAAVAAPVGGSLAACTGSSSGSSGVHPVRLGLVSPQTGYLAPYSDPDDYVVDSMRNVLSAGITVGRSTHPVEIVVRDSQSDRNQAATAAAELIFDEEVDIVLVGGTSETTNPVADQCEAFEVPCISTMTPWEAWFEGRGGTTETPFNWTYHFYWGMADIARVYRFMWSQIETNKRVGVLWPNDLDGGLFKRVFQNEIGAGGFTLVSPTPDNLYEPDRFDAPAAVRVFQENNADIVTGLLPATDFATFWKEAGARSYFPRMVTVSRGLLFPDDVRSLGGSGLHLATEVSWSRSHPYKSSITGMSSADLAADYVRATGKRWVQSLGFAHALFEIAVAALADVESLDDRRAIANSIAGVKQSTIVGAIAFGSRADVPKNVAQTALVGGQWRRQENAFELHVVTNDGVARIQPEVAIEPLQGGQA